MVELPDVSEYEELGEEVVDIKARPSKPKPSRSEIKKQDNVEEAEERKIAQVANDKYHTRQQTYFVAFDTDNMLKEISRAIEEKSGHRPGKGKIIDEIVATFGKEYLDTKMKSI